MHRFNTNRQFIFISCSARSEVHFNEIAMVSACTESYISTEWFRQIKSFVWCFPWCIFFFSNGAFTAYIRQMSKLNNKLQRKLFRCIRDWERGMRCSHLHSNASTALWIACCDWFELRAALGRRTILQDSRIIHLANNRRPNNRRQKWWSGMFSCITVN